MHFRIKRNMDNEEIVPSKTLTSMHCGFRRFDAKPIFSQEINPNG